MNFQIGYKVTNQYNTIIQYEYSSLFVYADLDVSTLALTSLRAGGNMCPVLAVTCPGSDQ